MFVNRLGLVRISCYAMGRFNTRRANWETFSDSLEEMSKLRLETIEINSAKDVEEMAKILTSTLSEVCEETIRRKKQF